MRPVFVVGRDVRATKLKTLLLVLTLPLTAAAKDAQPSLNGAGTLRARVTPTRAAPARAAPARIKPARIKPARIKRLVDLKPRRRKLPPRLGPRRWVNWGHGEQMTYTVRLAGVEGGRAAISVGRPKRIDGRRTLQLRGLGETVPFISAFNKMSEEVVTSVDLSGLTPLLSKADRKGSGKSKTRYIETLYVPSSLEVGQRIKRNGRTIHRGRRIPRPLHDGISALYTLRSLRWPMGAARNMLVLAGNSLYRIELRAAAKERLYTRLGARDTVRLDGIARRIYDNMRLIKRKQPRNLSIWLTTDAAAIPVKISGQTIMGPIEASISSYTPPRQQTRVRVAQAPRLPPLPPAVSPLPQQSGPKTRGTVRRPQRRSASRSVEGARSQGQSIFRARR